MGYLEKSIVVDAPVTMCFNHWSNVANYPYFMAGIRQVEPGDETTGEEGVFHWTGQTPGGQLTTWDMILEDVIPNRLIAWRSAANNPVFQTEIVNFEPLPADQCRITVSRSFQDQPPRGEYGTDRMAPSEHLLAEDLKVFKNRLEQLKPSVRMMPQHTVDLVHGNQGITSWPVIRIPRNKTPHPPDAPGEVPDIGGEYSNIGVSDTTRKSDFEWFV